MTRVAKVAASWIAAILVLAMVYGIAIEPRLWLDERRATAEIPGLPDELAGTRVAVFADLQIGMWWANIDMVERIVDRTLEQDPDLILLAGDFVYSHSPDPRAQVDRVMDLLEPLLTAGIPTYAVMGNHDYDVGVAEELTERLEAAGVQVLRNAAATVPGGPDGVDALHVVGIGAYRPGHSQPEEAFAGLPDAAPRVVFMHNPASFPAIDAHRAPLAVAGHTHCGQIAIPGLPAWSYLALWAEERVVVDGFAPVAYGAEGNRLFVTCGIGFSIVPMRISAPPQLVTFELVPAAARSSLARTVD